MVVVIVTPDLSSKTPVDRLQEAVLTAELWTQIWATFYAMWGSILVFEIDRHVEYMHAPDTYRSKEALRVESVHRSRNNLGESTRVLQ